MTRKEAKEVAILTLVKENDELKTEIGRLRQALEQKSCKDTISREAVLKEIPVLWNSNGDKDYCMETLRDFVSELPPAVPARKKGKWIKHTSNMTCEDVDDFGDECWDGTTYECSICHKEHFHATNFCPNCGTEMEGEE